MAREAMDHIVVNVTYCDSRPHKPAGEVTSRSLVTAYCQAGMPQRPQVAHKLRHQRGKFARIHHALMTAATLLQFGHRRPPLVAIKDSEGDLELC
jgi:hypothetical protein